MPKNKKKSARTKQAPPPPPEAGKTDLPEFVKIRCPICQTNWANARIEFGQPILPKHFSAREDLGMRVKFQKNGLPFCPVCNFRYDEKAMYGLLIAAANEEEMERKAWGKGKFDR